MWRSRRRFSTCTAALSGAEPMARPEDRLQSRCRMFLDACLPAPCWWSSVGHERKQTLIQGAMQKARGIKRGLPDIMVWAPGYFLGVELKAGANKATDAQQQFASRMAALGHGAVVVRSVEALGEALVQHGIPMAQHWRVAAQSHDAALDVAPAKHAPRKPKRIATKPTLRQIARGNRLSLVGVRSGA